MQTTANNVFVSQDTTFTSGVGQGQWIDMAQYQNWSLHVSNLESDGKIDVYLSNDFFKPTTNASAVKLTEITATVGNANAMYQGNSQVAKWMLIVKTNGAVPATTVVNVFAQIS